MTVQDESSSPGEVSTGAADREDGDGRARPRYLRVARWALLISVLYLLSYGPAVMRVLNRYGQMSEGHIAVLKTLYAPAAWLADHSAAYNGYRHLWVMRSRNADWWIRHAHQDEGRALEHGAPKGTTTPRTWTSVSTSDAFDQYAREAAKNPPNQEGAGDSSD